MAQGPHWCLGLIACQSVSASSTLACSDGHASWKLDFSFDTPLVALFTTRMFLLCVCVFFFGFMTLLQ